MSIATLDASLAHKAIGQIAVDLPGSTAVFRRLKLDFCCGGQVSLQHACAQKGLDTDAVLARLAALTRDHTPPPGACNTWRALYADTEQLTEDLISHIHLENNVLFPRFESAGGRGGARSFA